MLVKRASGEGTGGLGYRQAGFGHRLPRTDGQPGLPGTETSQHSPQGRDLSETLAPTPVGGGGTAPVQRAVGSSQERRGRLGWGAAPRLRTPGHGVMHLLLPHTRQSGVAGGRRSPIPRCSLKRRPPASALGLWEKPAASRLPGPRTPSPGTETHRPGLSPTRAGAGMSFNVDAELLN